MERLIGPVGLSDIARHLRVKPTTPRMWQHRHLMPEPRWRVSGAPVWDWEQDILPWAEATNRLPEKVAR